MKKWLLIVLFIGMIGWVLFDTVFTQDNQGFVVEENTTIKEDTSTTGLAPGNQAPDFQMKLLNGDEVQLSDYKGTPIMLNFWATWCPPCRAEMPDMQKVYESGEYDMEILAVNLLESETSLDGVDDFVDELALTFPILLDENNNVADQYQIQPIPTSFFIDKEGLIHSVSYGPLNHDMLTHRLEEMQ